MVSSWVIIKMISIIVPVYNGEDYIQNNYSSLLSQSITEFEIIYVDDGSTDDSLNILNSLQSQDIRVRILKQKNTGAIFARMLGVQHAKYSFVTFIDVDDTVTPIYLLEFKTHLMDGFDIVATGFTLFNPLKDTRKFKNNIPADVYKPIVYLENILTKGSWELCAKVFNKRLFDNIVLPNRRISVAEDTFIFMQLVANCTNNILVTDTYNYIYNFSASSISRQKNLNHVEDALYVGRELKILLGDHADIVSLNCMVLLLYSNSLRRGMINSDSLSFLVVKESFNVQSLMKISLLKSFYIFIMYFLNRGFK